MLMSASTFCVFVNSPNATAYVTVDRIVAHLFIRSMIHFCFQQHHATHGMRGKRCGEQRARERNFQRHSRPSISTRFELHSNSDRRVVKLAMLVDKLVEIPPSDWLELRDLYSPNWPENHVAWHTINNYVNWFRMLPNIKHLRVWSLNGSWRSDGTYVIVVSSLRWNFPVD